MAEQQQRYGLLAQSPLGATRVCLAGSQAAAAWLVSLSLALGACVAAFSLVDALILRPLPVRQPERLMYLTFPTYTPERPEAAKRWFQMSIFSRSRQVARMRAE